MDNSIFFEVYVVALLVCVALLLIVIKFLSAGLKKFFSRLIQDEDVTSFFVRLVTLVLFLGGTAGALKNDYLTDPEKANWLTLSWNATDQLEAMLNSVFGALVLFTIVFLIVELLNRRYSK